MPNKPPLHPKSLVDPPPEDMLPQDLRQAFIAIASLQLTCQNQEDKLTEQGEDLKQLRADNEEQSKKIDKFEQIISMGSGMKMLLFWFAAAIVGASTIWANFRSSK